MKTFDHSDSFADILQQAAALPGVDPNDPELAPLLAQLAQDPGFGMVGFSPQATALATMETELASYGPPPGWTPPEPTTLKVGDDVRWWPMGKPPVRKRAQARGLVSRVDADGFHVDIETKQGLYSRLSASALELVTAAPVESDSE
jgi:hypothetical protein